jgi:hypothetical protein
MRTALSFFVVLVAFSSLTACQQMYTRLVADSKAVAERLNLKTTASADSTATKPAMDSSVATENANVRSDELGAAVEKPVSSSHASNPGPATYPTITERTMPSDRKPEALPPSVADNKLVAQNKPPVGNSSRRSVTSNTPVSDSQSSHTSADSQAANEKNDVYQRAHSNQVILREGDVSIDFSKDMPAINSRIGIDLNSQ